jgi:hypothetical protein
MIVLEPDPLAGQVVTDEIERLGSELPQIDGHRARRPRSREAEHALDDLRECAGPAHPPLLSEARSSSGVCVSTSSV